RHDRVITALEDKVGFTSEQRLVDLQAGDFDHYPVDDDLVAGAQFDNVVEHHFAGQQFTCPIRPAHQRLGLSDDGQFVQCLLGAQFLNHADDAVGDDQKPEQSIDQRAGCQHDDEQHAQDRVDPGEDVGCDDVGHAAHRPAGNVVGLAVGNPLGYFGVGESG